MNILETLFSVFPLQFGNITVAAIILSVLYGISTLIVQIGISLAKFAVAADDKNAPKYELSNPLMLAGNKLLINMCSFSNIVYESDSKGKYFMVKSKIPFMFKDLKSSGFSWPRGSIYFKDCKCYDISSVENYEKKRIGVIKTLLPLIITDLFFFMLSVSFIPTLCIAGTVLTLFTTRTLAKKFYKISKDNGDKLSKHDKEIEELKSK